MTRADYLKRAAYWHKLAEEDRIAMRMDLRDLSPEEQQAKDKAYAEVEQEYRRDKQGAE